MPLRSHLTARVQGDGQGLGQDTSTHPQVLPDEDAVAGRLATNPDPSQQPADGRGHERSDARKSSPFSPVCIDHATIGRD